MYNVEYNTHYAHYAHTNTEDWTSENLFLYYMNLNCHGGHYHHNHSTIINTHVCTGKKRVCRRRVCYLFIIIIIIFCAWFLHPIFTSEYFWLFWARKKNRSQQNKCFSWLLFSFIYMCFVLLCYVMYQDRINMMFKCPSFLFHK